MRRRQRDGLAGIERGLHRRGAGRLDADDPDPGRDSFTAAAMPASNPPPPTGTTTAATSGALLEDLQAGSALAGDDPRVIERRHDGQAAGGGLGLGALAPMGRSRAGEDHSRRRTPGLPPP